MSSDSRISANYIVGVIDNLRGKGVRESTAANYLAIWRSFNKFLIKLDEKPVSWEDRVLLFCGYLVDNGYQSCTIKSYVSAIKATLKEDSYNWDDSKFLLGSLTKACRLLNDKMRCRLPITVGLLEMLLFEIQRVFEKQPYLEKLYKAIFILGYYGLMRIGELVQGPHTMKAKDIYIGKNKNKILIFLYTSKTHGLESKPQQIKITALEGYENKLKKRHFCPFAVIRQFLAIRSDYEDELEHFFVFNNKVEVTPTEVRTVLRGLLTRLNLNPMLYNTHSLRAGMSVDLNWMGYSIPRIQSLGRWTSSAVYRYLK